MKSVLLHIDGTAEQEARFQLAADVVRAMEGHLTCLQPVASMETYLPTDPFGISAFAGDALERARAWEKEQQDAIETRLRTENISWDWHAHPGAPAQLIADHSWLSELVVVSAPQQDWPGRLAVPPIAADVVMRARAPVNVVPAQTRHFDSTGTALLDWTGSAEVCQALRGAVPLLRLAAEVLVVTIPDEGVADFPPMEGAAFLSRHGIGSEIVEIPAQGRAPQDMLRAFAADRGAAWMVMGAYGHSRLREMLLGGTTREMLVNPPVPLLLAH